jgi:hypothetical protein
MREAFTGGIAPGVDIFAAAAALVCMQGSPLGQMLSSGVLEQLVTFQIGWVQRMCIKCFLCQHQVVAG